MNVSSFLVYMYCLLSKILISLTKRMVLLLILISSLWFIPQIGWSLFLAPAGHFGGDSPSLCRGVERSLVLQEQNKLCDGGRLKVKIISDWWMAGQCKKKEQWVGPLEERIGFWGSAVGPKPKKTGFRVWMSLHGSGEPRKISWERHYEHSWDLEDYQGKGRWPIEEKE